MQSSFIPIVVLITISLLAGSEQVPVTEDAKVNEIDVDVPEPVKRGWNQLHGAWGKRDGELFQDQDNLHGVLQEVTNQKNVTSLPTAQRLLDGS